MPITSEFFVRLGCFHWCSLELSTDGLQITTGSCNPAPIGTIPSVSNMPSAKFEFPTNMGTVTGNTEFTIKLNMNNLDTGNFVNANENYFAAPQQLNSDGQIIGHTHVVIEAINGLADTTPSDPQKFAFFKVRIFRQSCSFAQT